jgi:hypothetical protein
MTELAFLDKHCKARPVSACVVLGREDKDDESKAHLYCVVRWLSSVSSCARGRAEREAEAKKVGRHLSPFPPSRRTRAQSCEDKLHEHGQNRVRLAAFM